jgi:eukaryotic-like serine/threonine-protein kinase
MAQPSEREIEVFNVVLELPPAERAAYLDQVCAGDAALRRRVEELLNAGEEAGAFLGSPTANPRGPGGTIRLEVPPAQKPGDRIGRYKLLQQIGEGGCGVVYMAEQEEPVRRRVALKVIKLGMDTKNVIARFEAERQALALMDHPNIAKVLDAGATETGRPYFVMELVRGIKITDYCDQHNLSTPERLGLFIKVCQAIQHAHQKGIIHRDIKPSNILITVNDGVAVPKVIDFGIAKATQGRLTDKTLFTAFEQFIGTPAYMSPEQAVMTSLDIDTRSDIYSLGVLLYELLTGETPFDATKLLQSGLDEMRRTIREQEPARPSTRLSTMLEVELTTTARLRQTEPPRLIHLLRGDLDWIVMKALEKDRARRYETANGLAVDIQRHLTNEPVAACPPSNLYRLQKLVRRNKLAFIAAGGVVSALMFGLVVAIWLFVRERQIRQTQERLREQAELVSASQAVLLRKAEVRGKIADAKTLYDGQKYDEAEKLLNAIDPSLIGPDSMHAAICRGLAWHHVVQNQWNSAATNLAVLLRVNGLANTHDALSDDGAYAAALVEIGDNAGYERLRQALVGRYAGTSDPALAEAVCRTSLLLPADDTLMSELSPLYGVAAGRTFRRDGNADPKAWNHIALALVDYRRGNYAQAGDWCVGCLALSQQTTRIPTALVLRAMVHHQLHREDDASLELAYARDAIEPAFKTELPENNWFEWVDAHILLRQAMALIGDQTSSLKLTPFEANEVVRGTRNLIGNEHFQEAEEHVAELPAVAIEMEAENTRWLYMDLGLRQLVEGRRQEAAVRWRISILGPNDEGSLLQPWDMAMSSLGYAPLIVELGDKESYEKLRAAVVNATGDTDDPGVAERVLKTCLLLPADADLESQLNHMADVLRQTTAVSSEWYSWAKLSLGLFEYRRGNYAQALQLLPKDSAVEQVLSLESQLKATSHVITAMALDRLHQAGQARLELTQYRDVIESNFNRPLDLGTNTAAMWGAVGPWHDWWTAHILLREAESLIEGQTNAPTVDVKAKAN